jgi:hypothetical protein
MFRSFPCRDILLLKFSIASEHITNAEPRGIFASGPVLA